METQVQNLVNLLDNILGCGCTPNLCDTAANNLLAAKRIADRLLEEVNQPKTVEKSMQTTAHDIAEHIGIDMSKITKVLFCHKGKLIELNPMEPLNFELYKD